MSILLDALKKSEQQRRQGAAANAPAPEHQTSSAPTRSRPWLLVTLVALIAVILAALLWRHLGQPAAGQMHDVPATAAESPAPAPPAAEPADSEAPDTPKTLVAELPATRPPDPDEPAAQTPEEARAELGRFFAEYRSDEPAGDADASVDPRPAEGTTEPRPEPKPPSGSSPEPRASGPISYWELPQSVRDGLPDLHITVLVYAERPEDRFVLVGGQRMGEGHDIGGGLVLEEIRRDGAVFSYRKYRFVVKG